MKFKKLRKVLKNKTSVGRWLKYKIIKTYGRGFAKLAKKEFTMEEL